MGGGWCIGVRVEVKKKTQDDKVKRKKMKIWRNMLQNENNTIFRKDKKIHKQTVTKLKSHRYTIQVIKSLRYYFLRFSHVEYITLKIILIVYTYKHIWIYIYYVLTDVQSITLYWTKLGYHAFIQDDSVDSGMVNILNLLFLFLFFFLSCFCSLFF